MIRKMLVLGVLGCLWAAPVLADNYSLWPDYNVVTINTSNTGGGANVASTLTNYPVLVRLTSGNFTAFATAGTKASLRFARGATHLPYQVERWDSTGGNAAEIWVMVDTVFGTTAAQTLNMYWGKAGVGDSSNGTAVFDTAKGFTGVWHMDERQGTGPMDATANALNFTANATVPQAGGEIDSARMYAGGTAGTPDSTPFNPVFNIPNSTFTVSAWVNRASTSTAAYEGIFSNWRYSAGNYRCFILKEIANGAYGVQVSSDGTTDTRIPVTTATFSNAAWHYVAGTMSTANGIQIYVDGVLQALTGTATAVAPFVNTSASASPLIGAMEKANTQGFVGSIDEIEFSNNVERTPDWIRMNYQTQFSGETCVTVGPAVSPPPSNLTYSPNPAVYTVGFAIPNNTPTVTGVVTGYAVAPALPSGLSLNATTGVISGTPTAAASLAAYVVTASNGSGSTLDTVRITVNAALVAPSGLSYSTNPAAYATGAAITANTPTVTGTVTGYTVSPALPTGLSLNATTGVISGTPTVLAAAANYLVTASNSAGGTTAYVNISVIAPPTGLSYSTPTASYPMSTAITANTPTVTGTVSGYAVSPALPAGLLLNPSTGVISGTPTSAAAAANYTVTASNAAGSTSATLNITVYGPPSSLSYPSNPVTYMVGVAITVNTPSVTGTVTKYTVSPALPAGLKIDSGSGWITGTPTAATGGYSTFTVTATNGAGFTTVVLQILVQPSTAIARLVSNSYLIRISGASPVAFTIPDGATQVRLSILDVWGRTVWSQTVEPVKLAGIHEFSWNGMGSNGRRISAGLYIARVNILGADGTSSGTVEQKINLDP